MARHIKNVDTLEGFLRILKQAREDEKIIGSFLIS